MGLVADLCSIIFFSFFGVDIECALMDMFQRACLSPVA